MGRPPKEENLKKRYQRTTVDILTDKNDIANILLKDCCKEKCMSKAITRSYLEEQRAIFKNKNQTQQRQHLLDIVRANGGPFLNGRQVCQGAFGLVFRSSPDRIKGVMDMWRSGIQTVTRYRTSTDVVSQGNAGVMINFITAWKENNCSPMPDNQSYEAPIGTTRRMIRDEINKRFQYTVHESTIGRLLKDHFPDQISNHPEIHKM